MNGVTRAIGRRLKAVRPPLRILAAEAIKQHRQMFGSRVVLFSLLVWPAIQLGVAYFAFKPFETAPGIAGEWSLAADPRSVLLFFATGSLAHTFFWSLVQSAWFLSFERQTGTLELLFLTPANRLAIIVANGAMAMVQSVWLFVTFITGLVLLVGGFHVAHPLMLAIAFLSLLVPAIAWAAFLNSLLLFSRDSGFLYTVLDEPMAFAAGVRVPPFALPFLVRVAGLVFPLATSLFVLRGVLLDGSGLVDLLPALGLGALQSVLLLLAAARLLQWGEDHARQTGSLTLF